MGGKGSGGARAGAGSPKSPDFIAKAVKLGQEIGPKEAAAQLTAEGTPVSWRSVYNWINGEKGARKPGVLPRPRRDVSAARRGKGPGRPKMLGPSVAKVTPLEPPPTENDRKVDELVSQSRTWRRVQEALGRFARRHPEVAADLASELRGLSL